MNNSGNTYKIKYTKEEIYKIVNMKMRKKLKYKNTLDKRSEKEKKMCVNLKNLIIKLTRENILYNEIF